ncbi:hypothetical protein TIFTF001_039477 [Ficus carica]|uniref:Uncharacterized protein n=1 Tax=Ficus carica TaxID=3494 RepID=A0AA88ECE9_FICCA|nr:hypothetical protein TIFTF001_039477 [Ficus carica]
MVAPRTAVPVRNQWCASGWGERRGIKMSRTCGGGGGVEFSEEIAAVGSDYIVDPSPISTIEGEVTSCVDTSSSTRSATQQRLEGDCGGGR